MFKPPPIKRHPFPDEVLDRYLNQKSEKVHLYPPPGSSVPARLNNTSGLSLDTRRLAYQAYEVMNSKVLPGLLEKATGPASVALEKLGLSHNVSLFAFDASGETVIALPEHDKRYASWFWLPRSGHQGWQNVPPFSNADSPELVHFWPDFVEGLMWAIGKSILRPDLVFAPDSPPAARFQAKALSETLGSTRLIHPGLLSKTHKSRL